MQDVAELSISFSQVDEFAVLAGWRHVPELSISVCKRFALQLELAKFLHRDNQLAKFVKNNCGGAISEEIIDNATCTLWY
jgi:hypothetical protein